MTTPQSGAPAAPGRDFTADSPLEYGAGQPGFAAGGPGSLLAGDAGIPGPDLSDSAAGTAMTRAEERLWIDTATVEGGRIRVRKYIVTEDVTITVQLSREEVRLEWVPGDPGNDLPESAGPVSPAVFELILNAEQPVVTKRIVPAERVRLVTEVVTENVVVNETLRKEQIEEPDTGSAA